jgi:hypothetical protein
LRQALSYAQVLTRTFRPGLGEGASNSGLVRRLGSGHCRRSEGEPGSHTGVMLGTRPTIELRLFGFA